MVPKGQTGLYHCMSRTVGGDFLFGPAEKEELFRRMWHLAEFLSIEILDFVIMSNHYHQLLEVPGYVELSDDELLGKVTRYYGIGSFQAVQLETLLLKGGDHADYLRQRYHKWMGNLSHYQKILKQGFSRWYNKPRNRKGAFWMERFKSVVVEDDIQVLQSVSAYIDLNPVRASIVEDPKDFHYSAYAMALAGDKRCRKGLMRIMGTGDWESAAAQYRIKLMQTGSKQVEGKSGAVSRELLLDTIHKGGKLSLPELLRLRIRYFTEGQVLGTEAFVEDLFILNKSHFPERRTTGARPFKGLASCSLFTLRQLRNAVFS